MADAPLGPGSAVLRLRAADGVGLRVARRPGGGRGVALVLQGRTEFLEKYAPAADALAARGFEVVALDWRGQGGSDRPVGDGRRGHVGAFAEFQTDIAALTATVPEARAPALLLAHSMGGCIALRALVSGALAPVAVVFSAPMWGLAQGGLVGAVARGLARAGVALGLGRRYAPGGGPTPYSLTDPADNLLTADPAQAAWIAEATRANADRALGGPTLGWLAAAYAEMDALAALPLRRPATVVVGGDERVVSRAAIAARAARDGLTVAAIPGGRHELMFETPDRRAAFWAALDAELAARGA